MSKCKPFWTCEQKLINPFSLKSTLVNLASVSAIRIRLKNCLILFAVAVKHRSKAFASIFSSNRDQQTTSVAYPTAPVPPPSSSTM